MTGPYGLVPFDLQAATRVLLGRPHDREVRKREVKLGSDEDSATLEVYEWGHCRPSCRVLGSHEAGRSARLLVPCDTRPHCHSCECLDSHYITLSDEQLAALKGVLP